MRKTHAWYGPYGRRVRVFEEGDRVIAQWYIGGAPQRQSWPLTRENIKTAKAWARGFADRRSGVTSARRPTTREMWDRYWEAESGHLRPRSKIRYRERWSWWEEFVGRDSFAEDVTIETAGRFRRALEMGGKATNQVRLILGVARIVYNWAQRARLIRENPLAAYRFKVAKDAPKNEPAEYRRSDFEKIIDQFSPQHGAQWRGAVALAIIGNQGVRQNAALHLRWSDVDWVTGLLTWQGDFDKTGDTWRQPMRLDTYAALLTARWWRERDGYAGPWVFPPARERNKGPYTAQSLWHQLTRAERAAKVPHLELRAAHGLRRMVVNDLLAQGTNIEAAAQFINDKDLRVVRRSYKRQRMDDMQKLADQLDGITSHEETQRHERPTSRQRSGPHLV